MEVYMKGSEIIIQILNEQLADELTAVNQYMVHAGMCANWGYEKLHNTIEKRAIEEMKHAESLIDRILFLNGIPTVSKLNKVSIGAKVDLQIKNDLQAELGAAASYNAGIKKAVEVGDNGTRELFESILKDEERHIDWLEAQLDQIDHMTLPNYLVEQLG
jgi:bacterioferritin